MEKCIHFFFGHFVSGCYQISCAPAHYLKLAKNVSFLFSAQIILSTLIDFFEIFSNTFEDMNIQHENEGNEKKFQD